LWRKRRQQPTAYRECAHPPIAFDRDSLPLNDLLNELLSDQFLARLIGMRPGREELGLRGDPLVQRITRRLTMASDTKSTVEAFLDRLFVDLRPKHVFVHTETVIALFYSMKAAGVEYLQEVLTPFADSRAAEVSALSNFAKTLLR
jgi:hypothetical protein